MQTITKCLAVFILILNVHLINAQDSIPAIKNSKNIEMLEKVKITIQEQERGNLKEEVIAINERLAKNEITFLEAENLKKEGAKKHALNIENRIAIIDNRIALLKRNDYGSIKEEAKRNLFGVNISSKSFNIKTKRTPPKYDIRTSNDLLFAIGFNNALVDGEKLDDSPYKFGSSGFVELGWNWKTRLLKESNFLRLKYGFTFQWNKLRPNDNNYFVQQGNQTVLEEFPESLKKSKLIIANLVFPLHLEFGPSRKLDRKDRIRYINNNKFKIGIGGYGGFNIGTRQKLKYDLNGQNRKDKQKQSFNTSNLVYGLSSYIGFGDTALYVKYDLSPIFKDQVVDQHNISIGLRFDMD